MSYMVDDLLKNYIEISLEVRAVRLRITSSENFFSIIKSLVKDSLTDIITAEIFSIIQPGYVIRSFADTIILL